MSSIVGLDDLSKALIEAGNNLLRSHSSTDELLALLDETESLLTTVEQDQPPSMQNALIPSKNALVSAGLLSHPDSDVMVSVVSCLTEILRIAAPEAPYSDDLMKEIFRLTIDAFEKLDDLSSRSYKKAESVLDNVSKVRSCLVMLDLECDDLILQMFQKFLKIIRSDHPRVVFSSMEMIMITIIDETEEISTDLLNILLSSVRKENQNVSPTSWSLVEKVLSRCARKLKLYIIEALKSTGTSLDMYSPVVSSICHSVSDTTKVHNTVNTKENEAAQTKLERRVAPRNPLEEKLHLGHSRKVVQRSSKRPVRNGTRRINENDKVQSESTDAETELGTNGKRGRKPNSLMNPEEGYDIAWISRKQNSLKTSSNKTPKKKVYGGESSLGKASAKKTPLPKETSTTTSRALMGSLKRSRVKMDDSDNDLDSFSSPRLKKLASCFGDEEPREEESNQESFETPEDDRKIGKSSKKIRSQNGFEKCQRTAKKKPAVEARIVNSSGKRSSARSDAKRNNSEGSFPDTSVSQSSKSKKMVSQVAARPLAEESEETPKSHPTRRRTARKEVESNMIEFGEDLVGKRVNIWWPLDKTFYEGVIESYNSSKKFHRVIYYDGDSEELNLNKERWELIEDHASASENEDNDLPECLPLSDIIQRQKIKKIKNVAMSVEPTSSAGVRSSSRTLRKINSGKKMNKQVERCESGSKSAVISEGIEKRKEGKNLKSLKELNAKIERREEQEVSRDAESERREEKENKDDCSEGKEQSENKVEDQEQYPNSEVASEGEELDSEEEPKWRETEDMEEDEVEEREEVDDKGRSTNFSEMEKEEEEEEEEEDEERES